MATVTDQKYRKDTNADDIGDYALPAIKTAYDYYPFGMLMPERYTAASENNCATITLTEMVEQDPTTIVTGGAFLGNMYPVYAFNTNPTPPIPLANPDNITIEDGGVVVILRNLPVDTLIEAQMNVVHDMVSTLSYMVIDSASNALLAGVKSGETHTTLRFTPGSTTAYLKVTFTPPPSVPASSRAFSVNSGVALNRTYIPATITRTVCETDEDEYRFGYAAGEKINEIMGIGNYVDLGERGVDTRLGRLNGRPDPLAKKFPSESPYIYAGNNPIYYVDKEGKYKVSAENEASYNRDYPLIMKYLSTQIESDISNSTKIINGLVSTNPNIKPSSVKGISKWGFGPEIVFKDAQGEFPREFKGAAGYTEKDAHVIQMNAGYAKYVEKVLTIDASPKVKQVAFMRFYMTLIHETGHELNKYGEAMGQNARGHDTYRPLSNGYSSDEQGYKAEENIWGTDNYKPFSNPSLDKSEGAQGIGSDKYRTGVTEGVINEASKTEEGRKSLPTVPTP